MGGGGGVFDTVANVATLGGYDALDINGSKAKGAAIGAQTSATGNANAAIRDSYAQQQSYLNPYNEAGGAALNQLSSGNLVDPNTIGQDAGYQFRLAEGNKAINNSAAARGMGNSGAALKQLTAYGQNMASDEYDKAYNRQYNRLSQLAGYGSNASNNLASAAGTYGSNMSNNYLGLGNATAAANIAQSNNTNALIGQGIGAAASFSDERLKKNIVPITKEEIEEMRKELRAFYFDYKDQIHGEGRWIGIMAQDLEKSKLGKTIVVENARGEKMIDMHKVHSIFLATMAEAA